MEILVAGAIENLYFCQQNNFGRTLHTTLFLCLSYHLNSCFFPRYDYDSMSISKTELQKHRIRQCIQLKEKTSFSCNLKG